MIAPFWTRRTEDGARSNSLPAGEPPANLRVCVLAPRKKTCTIAAARRRQYRPTDRGPVAETKLFVKPLFEFEMHNFFSIKKCQKTYLQPMCERRKEGRERNGKEVRGPCGLVKSASEEGKLEE